MFAITGNYDSLNLEQPSLHSTLYHAKFH